MGVSDFVTIELQMNEFAKDVKRYVSELGRDGPTVVKTQARLLILQLVKITPPKNLSQGRKAVARDVRRAVAVIDERKMKIPWLATAIKDGELDVVNAFLSRVKKGPLKGMRAVQFYSTLHTRQRNRRGRVSRQSRIIGLPGPKVRKYLATVQARVGQAKSGFYPALQRIGGTLPGWIARHGGKFGEVLDVKLDPGELDPQITVLNRAKGTYAIDRRAVATAIDYRQRAMKTDIKLALERAAKAANLAA